jgi:hypothetical protein
MAALVPNRRTPVTATIKVSEAGALLLIDVFVGNRPSGR